MYATPARQSSRSGKKGVKRQRRMSAPKYDAGFSSAAAPALDVGVVLAPRRGPPVWKPELKFSTSTTGTPYNALYANTAVITSLNELAQGTTGSTRIGEKVKVTSIDFAYALKSDWATTPDAQVVRVLLVWDLQPNGALPAATDILTTAVPASPFNQDKVPNRFKVLLDNVHTVGAVTQNIDSCQTFRQRVKIDRVTTYNGTTASYTNIVTGNLVFLIIAEADMSYAYKRDNTLFYYD